MPVLVRVGGSAAQREVIEETLRLYPAVPSGLPRVVPPEGATFRGVWLPGGTTVLTQAYSLHRDPVAFPDAETFDPSRWEHPTQAMKECFYPFGGEAVCGDIARTLGQECRHSLATIYFWKSALDERFRSSIHTR